MEEISTELYRLGEVIAVKEGWIELLYKKFERLQEAPWEEVKTAYYLTKAGKRGDPLLLERRRVADEAYDIWTEYWRLQSSRFVISLENIEGALKVLRRLHDEKVYSKGPFVWNPYLGDFGKDMIKRKLDVATEDIELVEKALNTGYFAYHIFLSITPLLLFAI